MMKFEKILTKNDIGLTNSHQAGFLVPKGMKDLLEFLPYLDPTEYNPSVILCFLDPDNQQWEFKYIYYNNRLHSKSGTRNEYRITRTTGFMRAVGACEGDGILLSKNSEGIYQIELRRADLQPSNGAQRVLLSGWNRVY